MPGWRQQAAASLSSAARSRSPIGHTAVGAHALGNQVSAWLFAWAWGRKSASDIVRDAHAYSFDNVGALDSDAIKRLATTWSNIKATERVVERVLPTERSLIMEHIERNCVEWVLLPYSTFHWLLKNHPRKFLHTHWCQV